MSADVSRAWDLVERLRRAACFEHIAQPHADMVEELGALLDEGGILDAAATVLDDEDIDAPVVQVDTREQTPFRPFLWKKGSREFLEPKLVTLAEGDYTSPAVADFVRIERKSIADLYGTLFGSGTDALGASASQQERFRRELLRLRGYARPMLVIEGMPRDLVDYIIVRRRRVDPAGGVQLVESLSFDYGVPVRWCRDREQAEWLVGYLLSRAHAQATQRAEARKAARRGLVLGWALKEAA
jgi:DNA excision repair protein ERCC-4